MVIVLQHSAEVPNESHTLHVTIMDLHAEVDVDVAARHDDDGNCSISIRGLCHYLPHVLPLPTTSFDQIHVGPLFVLLFGCCIVSVRCREVVWLLGCWVVRFRGCGVVGVFD